MRRNPNNKPLNEYNGIAVGDCVRITRSDCYDKYESWLLVNGFDRTGWSNSCIPPVGATGFVRGIAKHLTWENILFYVDLGDQKYIMSESDIELEYKIAKKETKNYCLVNKGKMNFYIIE